ncbi:uncharacterized protein LOC134769370 [Penaeus indicus]|uniref:uncharacterized protein LOC134769370 n=1 Tax=Penaeus indicus TaxID=29960 RepID=UPI00300D58F4
MPRFTRLLPRAIRVYKDRKPLNRIRIIWKGEQPPPSTYHFFGEYMPASHVRPWRASLAMCYNCMGSGHVAKYCKDKARCAACGEQHTAKECPRSAAGEESTAEAPAFVPSCFRCGMTGVTARHWGCTPDVVTARIRLGDLFTYTSGVALMDLILPGDTR